MNSRVEASPRTRKMPEEHPRKPGTPGRLSRSAVTTETAMAESSWDDDIELYGHHPAAGLLRDAPGRAAGAAGGRCRYSRFRGPDPLRKGRQEADSALRCRYRRCHRDRHAPQNEMRCGQPRAPAPGWARHDEPEWPRNELRVPRAAGQAHRSSGIAVLKGTGIERADAGIPGTVVLVPGRDLPARPTRGRGYRRSLWSKGVPYHPAPGMGADDRVAPDPGGWPKAAG
jgi:hypothetical protein